LKKLLLKNSYDPEIVKENLQKSKIKDIQTYQEYFFDEYKLIALFIGNLLESEV